MLTKPEPSGEFSSRGPDYFEMAGRGAALNRLGMGPSWSLADPAPKTPSPSVIRSNGGKAPFSGNS
jgi:hypothetical protein